MVLPTAFVAWMTVACEDTSSSGGDVDAATTPPDGKIAFVTDRDGVDHIYIMNTDGTGVVPISSGAFPDGSPQWSPDGTRIVFSRLVYGSGIYVMDAAGTNVRRLSPTPAIDGNPGWSPDGTQVVFNRIVGGPPPSEEMLLPFVEIDVMSASDGSGTTLLLAANDTYNIQPSWSPDGSKIAFVSGRDDGSRQIYTMNADGSSIAKLTSEDSNGDPVWSPDGTRIAFGTDRGTGGVGGVANIWMMNADGSNPIQIRSVESGGEGDVSFSPDGAKIVFQHNGAQGAEVWMMNADGTGAESLGQSCQIRACSPRWQP